MWAQDTSPGGIVKVAVSILDFGLRTIGRGFRGQFPSGQLRLQIGVRRRVPPGREPQVAQHLPARDKLADDELMSLGVYFPFPTQLALLIELVKRFHLFVLFQNKTQDHGENLLLAGTVARLKLNHAGRAQLRLQFRQIHTRLAQKTTVDPRVKQLAGRVTMRILARPAVEVFRGVQWLRRVAHEVAHHAHLIEHVLPRVADFFGRAVLLIGLEIGEGGFQFRVGFRDRPGQEPRQLARSIGIP